MSGRKLLKQESHSSKSSQGLQTEHLCGRQPNEFFILFLALDFFFNIFVTPQTRGSVDYPSIRGIQVDVGLPDATSENRAESPLYRELYQIQYLYKTCIYLSQTVQYMQYISNTATWAHKQYSIYMPTIYPIVTRVQMFYSHTTYIKILNF